MGMLPEKVQDTHPLDPAECFDLWLELGSLQKVVNYYTKKGLWSRVTGRNLSIFGVRIAAYRWMYDHMAEAYDRCVQAGSNLDWDEFRMFVLQRYVGSSLTSNKKAEIWLKENDFYDPDYSKGYRKIYERKFGRIHRD